MQHTVRKIVDTQNHNKTHATNKNMKHTNEWVLIITIQRQLKIIIRHETGTQGTIKHGIRVIRIRTQHIRRTTKMIPIIRRITFKVTTAVITTKMIIMIRNLMIIRRLGTITIRITMSNRRRMIQIMLIRNDNNNNNK